MSKFVRFIRRGGWERAVDVESRGPYGERLPEHWMIMEPPIMKPLAQAKPEDLIGEVIKHVFRRETIRERGRPDEHVFVEKDLPFEPTRHRCADMHRLEARIAQLEEICKRTLEVIGEEGKVAMAGHLALGGSAEDLEEVNKLVGAIQSALERGGDR